MSELLAHGLKRTIHLVISNDNPERSLAEEWNELPKKQSHKDLRLQRNSYKIITKPPWTIDDPNATPIQRHNFCHWSKLSHMSDGSVCMRRHLGEFRN